MRKTLSLLISVIMILSLSVVGISAAEGKAITNADEFMSMAIDGTYYLANDITLNSTYDAIFLGVLDGNGKTVTVSAPMFENMNGTVKNLTVEGSVTVSGGNAGSVAMNSKGGKFENILNRASVTSTLPTGSGCIGGICGKISNSLTSFIGCTNEADVTGPESIGGICGESQYEGNLFDSCYNKGNITATDFVAGGIIGYSGTANIVFRNCLNDGSITSASRAGGIHGDARKSATYENCTNNGDVYAPNHAGGILAYAFDKTTVAPLTFTGCVNNGNISAYKEGVTTGSGVAGGIVANVSNSGGGPSFSIVNCLNNGTIKGRVEAGGFIGYLYGTGETFVDINGSINNGDIYAGEFASEFVSYSNQNKTVIKNSIGTGKLYAIPFDGVTAILAIVSLSGHDIANYTIENIYLADDDTTTLLSWAIADANVRNRIPISAVIGQDLTGAVISFEGNERTVEASNVKAIMRGNLDLSFIASANAAIGSNLFTLKGDKAGFASLKVGSTLDAPEPVDPPATEPEVTDPVTPPTTEPDSPVTGDNAYVVVAALAVVTVIGSACFFTRKKANE